MPEDRKRPQVAQVEEYDSEAGAVRPDTLVQARRKTAASRPSSGPPARSQHRDTATDSGYSSPNGKARTEATVATLSRPVPRPTLPKGKAVIHGGESKRSEQREPSRPAARSSQTAPCLDLRCAHPNCQSARSAERRYTLPTQYRSTTPQYQHYQPQPQQQPSYQPIYDQMPTATPPIPIAQARPRQGSMSRARPVSIHGYGSPSNAYITPQHGPPPSPSAYRNYWAAYYQQTPQQLAGYLPSTAANPMTANYVPPSPVAPSPTSPNWPSAPDLPRAYSARQINPDLPGYDATTLPASSHGLSRTLSARQPAPRQIPGAYPDPDLTDSETQSETESETDYSEDERERERQRRARARDSKLMPPPSRRPSIKERHTSQVVPSSTRNLALRRAPRSDSDLEYPSSSDYVDSDRTERAVVDHRTNSTYSSRSRRPSISTTASSGRTKATTLSSGSGSGSQKVIVEDRNGRRTAYLSKQAQADLMRRLQERQDLEDKVEAYQRQVRGQQPDELTAENIRQAQKSQRRLSGSHVSRTPSRRSGGSLSSSKSKVEGIKIQSGDTVLHVYGETKVQIMAGEDGGPAQFIIGNSSGKDSAYYGSKSSSSRVGRSGGGSDIRAIREEDGYEPAI